MIWNMIWAILIAFFVGSVAYVALWLGYAAISSGNIINILSYVVGISTFVASLWWFSEMRDH